MNVNSSDDRCVSPESPTMNRTALVGLLALIALPAPALAHAHLKSATPAAGTTLTVAPKQLVLTFSEAPALAMSALRLFGPDSTPVALGELTHDAGVRTLSASITAPLVPGRYTVQWQTAGDDGHVQRGSYQFVIAPGAEGLAAAASVVAQQESIAHPPGAASSASSATALPNASSFDENSVLYVIIRWAQFAALLLLIGAVAFRWWILPRTGVAVEEPARRALAAGAAATGSWGAWLLAGTAIARLLAQSASLHGAGHMADPVVLGPLITRTLWGDAWLLEIVAAIVAIVALRMARRDATSVLPWRVATLAVIALAFVPAMSGHAIATPEQAPIAVIVDAIHVLAAGAWLGGLAVMLAVGLPVTTRESSSGRASALSTMVNAFSPLALGSAGLLVFTGIIAARYHVGSWSAFTTTEYGRTLLIKLAIIVLLLVVAAWNWRRVRPSLATGAEGSARLTRSGRAEVLLAIVVLLITAILVALPTPVEALR
jgi:copper transport protein